MQSALIPEPAPAGKVLRYDPERQIIYRHTPNRFDVEIFQPPAARSRWSEAAMDGTDWAEQGREFTPAEPGLYLDYLSSVKTLPPGTVVTDARGCTLHVDQTGLVNQHPTVSPTMPVAVVGRFSA